MSQLAKTNLAQQAAHAIAEQIFNGTLQPGSRLIEETLSSELGVSRIPVREGLQILEKDGLVTRAPRRGVKVAEISERDVFEILTFREGLEHMAVDHMYDYVPNVDALDRSPAINAIHEMSTAFAQDTDRMQRVDASFNFHVELIRMCGNSKITQAYSDAVLLVKLCMIRNLQSLHETESGAENVERHRTLLAEVLSGNRNRAHKAVSNHGHNQFLKENK